MCSFAPNRMEISPTPQASFGSPPGSCLHRGCGCFHSPPLIPGSCLPSLPNPHRLYRQKLVICLIWRELFDYPLAWSCFCWLAAPPFCLLLFISLRKLSMTFLFPLCPCGRAQPGSNFPLALKVHLSAVLTFLSTPVISASTLLTLEITES